MSINASRPLKRGIVETLTRDIAPLYVRTPRGTVICTDGPALSAPKQRNKSINPKKQTVTGVL